MHMYVIVYITIVTVTCGIDLTDATFIDDTTTPMNCEICNNGIFTSRRLFLSSPIVKTLPVPAVSQH